MTTRKEALIALRDKVRDGVFDIPPGDVRAPFFNHFMRQAEIALPQHINAVNNLAWDAYKGSLDAALVLCEAVLPGWAWRVQTQATGSVQAWTDRAYGLRRLGFVGTTADNPARALLLAILEALIAEEE